MSNPNIWIVFALLSALFGALVPIFGKMGLSGIDSSTATAIRSVIMAIFLVGVISFQGKTDQLQHILSNNKAVLFIALSGIAGAISWLFYFLALKHGTVCQVVPLDRLSMAFAIIFALIFLGERLSLTTGAGVVIMLIGALIVTFG